MVAPLVCQQVLSNETVKVVSTIAHPNTNLRFVAERPNAGRAKSRQIGDRHREKRLHSASRSR